MKCLDLLVMQMDIIQIPDKYIIEPINISSTVILCHFSSGPYNYDKLDIDVECVDLHHNLSLVTGS